MENRKLSHQLDTSRLDIISLFVIPPGWRTGSWAISWTPHSWTWFLYRDLTRLENRELSHQLDTSWLDIISLFVIPPGWRTGSWAISWTPHGWTWFLYRDLTRLENRELSHQLDTSRRDTIPLLVIPPGWRTGSWAISWTPPALIWRTWRSISSSLRRGGQKSKQSSKKIRWASSLCSKPFFCRFFLLIFLLIIKIVCRGTHYGNAHYLVLSLYWPWVLQNGAAPWTRYAGKGYKRIIQIFVA